jgi:hypothetical protein
MVNLKIDEKKISSFKIFKMWTDEMVQFMINERKSNNDYYHTLVEGGKRMFWENIAMKLNLKYKSRFVGSQVKEKFQGIIRDCRVSKNSIIFLSYFSLN